MTIKDAAKIDMHSLRQFLAGRQRELPQDTIQGLDIALRECPSEKYVLVMIHPCKWIYPLNSCQTIYCVPY